MIKYDLTELVAEATRRARDEGDLPAVALPEVPVEHPQRPEHGDYASSLPLRLARAARVDALSVAESIVSHLPPSDALERVAVAPPGFINLYLSERWLAGQVDTILSEGERFGDVPLGGGKRVQIEFVSANPTGPLHVGNGRGAAIGSTLATVLRAAGYKVQTEYLVNDGTQVEVFGRTLFARYQQLFGREAPIPPDGYPGDYVIDIARAIRKEHGERFLDGADAAPPRELVDAGVNKVVDGIRKDLAALGVEFDNWFRERSLYGPNGLYEKVMALLRKNGYITEKEGAVWFASSALGEDRDSVLVRSTGAPTYFASDIPYHYDKFIVRGFDQVIDVWGADHQGHVSRMKAAVAALGVPEERLHLLLYQLVTLRRGAEVLRLSKRSGDIITVRDVVDEVGRDACRFFFLTRSADAPMDFDLELAKRHTSENPVYYVQYGHARIAGILNHARERGIDLKGGNVSLLTHPAELALVRKMLLLPELVESMARALEPHHLPHYALDLATAFHDFYEKCRVVTDDVALSKARLKLVAACRLVLGRTLGLMGVSAPERM
jgi:arginyl-tRNA synthetase